MKSPIACLVGCPRRSQFPKDDLPTKHLKDFSGCFGKKNTLRCALVRDFFQDLEDDLKSNRYRWILIWCCWILGDFFEIRLELLELNTPLLSMFFSLASCLKPCVGSKKGWSLVAKRCVRRTQRCQLFAAVPKLW